MVLCPSCGREVEKPLRETKNYSFIIQDYSCKKCHHYFRVRVNESAYLRSIT